MKLKQLLPITFIGVTVATITPIMVSCAKKEETMEINCNNTKLKVDASESEYNLGFTMSGTIIPHNILIETFQRDPGDESEKSYTTFSWINEAIEIGDTGNFQAKFKVGTISEKENFILRVIAIAQDKTYEFEFNMSIERNA